MKERPSTLSTEDIIALTTLAQDPQGYRATGLARGLLALNDAAIDYTESIVFPGQSSNKKSATPVDRPAALQNQLNRRPMPQ